MAENRSDIIIGTKSGDTEQKLKNIAKQLKNVGTTVTDTGKKAKAAGADMEKSFKRVGDAIQAVAMGATAKMAYSLAQEAASFQEVSQYAELMANRAGMSFDRLVSASQRGANGMASSAEIMKTNLKALRSGLKASEDDFGKLWQIADAMSDQMGVSITQAFEQITTAITTGNQKSLVSMGLLPEAFGRVSSATDLLTRRSETLKLVLEKLGPQAEEVSRQGDTAADKFTQLDNKVKDLKLHIGEQLLPVTTTLVEGLKDIAEYGIEAAKAIGWLTGGGTGVKNDVSKLGAVGVAEIKQQLINSKKAQRDDVLKLYNQATSGGLSSYDIQRVAKNYGGAGVKTNEDAITVLFSNLRALNKEIKNAETELENFKQKARVDIIVDQATSKAEEWYNTYAQPILNVCESIGTSTKKTADHTRDTAAEADKLLTKYGNLADSILPKIPETEKEAYDLLVKISAAAGGIGTAFMESDKNLESLNKRLEETLSKLSGDYVDSLTKNTLEAQFMSKGFGDRINGIGANMFALAGGNIGVNPITGEIAGTKVNPDDVKKTSKSFWSAIKSDYGEAMAAAMAQGIVDSNLGEALRSTISSIASSKASSYGSNILGSLFSDGKIATGALTGFVGSIAVSAIANNWEKWFGDKGKEETMKANAETRERGANAYLSTYSALLNPYMTDEMLADLTNSRNGAGGMVVRYKSKRAGGLRGLAGGKNYSDATPQETFDLIDAMESAVEAVEDYNKTKTKELELLEAQGYSYTVLGEQMTALTDTMDRIGGLGANQSYTWDNGQKYSIDLSDSIQDLKKAYYEALREYGQETANRTTQSATNFLSLFPFVDSVNYGSAGSEWIEDLQTYTKEINVGEQRLQEAVAKAREMGTKVSFKGDFLWDVFTPLFDRQGTGSYKDALSAAREVYEAYLNRGQTQTQTYTVDEGYMRYWDDRGSVGANANIEDIYNAVSKLTTDFLDRNATAGMLDVIKQAGANQFNLNALQYGGNQSDYASAYLKVLQRQQEAAQLVMKQQEEIYLDATKTFEEQSAALDMYQQAQDQYYSTKLEILAQEAAKEEQIKKEEAAANLRRQEQMEALLGFTGEIARTGNNVYILEGADQVGALKEMIQQYGDDPEALAALQAMLSAAQSKAKFGKIA